MLHFFSEYFLFLAETITIVVATLAIVAGIIALVSKNKLKPKVKLQIKNINEKFREMAAHLQQEILSKKDYKKLLKEEKNAKKIEANKSDVTKKRLFVLKFIGDVKATEASSLREEINAVLSIATPSDEVMVIIESPGGMVPNYGFAASQLDRIKQHNIPLVAAVDKVAASGGYLMACVADRILAAPFSYIGSIGVIAQVPNFHKLLKKHHIDFEQITAGEFKRTLTIFGENTEQGRKKMQEDVDEIHDLFKDFIKEHRPHVNIDQVATGEYWPAKRALELNLVDHLSTSDEYLLNASKTADIYEICYVAKKRLADKLVHAVQMTLGRLFFI